MHTIWDETFNDNLFRFESFEILVSKFRSNLCAFSLAYNGVLWREVKSIAISLNRNRKQIRFRGGKLQFIIVVKTLVAVRNFWLGINEGNGRVGRGR